MRFSASRTALSPSPTLPFGASSTTGYIAVNQPTVRETSTSSSSSSRPCPSRSTRTPPCPVQRARSEEHTSELQSRQYLVCRLLLEKKKRNKLQPVRIQ